VTSAASGGNTTVVDSQLVVRGFTDDDFFNGGTLLYQSGTAANRASRRVSDYAGATGTLTLEAALAVTPAQGDRYGVMTRRYPREVMVGKLNEALAEIGDIVIDQLSTQVTVAGQLLYTLPVDVCYGTATLRDLSELRQVWLHQTDMNSPGVPQYRVRRLTQAPQILFPEEPLVGYKIRYVGLLRYPVTVAADADVLPQAAISHTHSLDPLALATAEKLARWRLEGPGAEERDLTALLNNLTLRLAQARRRHPRQMPAAFPVLP
jgi:hypothetical protein